MTILNFLKVRALPEEPTPDTVYLTLVEDGSVKMHVTSTADEAKTVPAVHGLDIYTKEEIEGISLIAPLTGLDTTVKAPVTADDLTLSAFGKLQAQIDDMKNSQAFAVVEVVPSEFVGGVITVTTPNYRQFIWDGAKYVRAPWNQPGLLKYSYIDRDSMLGYIKVDPNTSLNVSDYPELAVVLGVTTDTFKLANFDGQFIRVLNTTAEGIDAGRTNLSIQEDCIRNITGKIPSVMHVSDAPDDSDAFTSGAFASCENVNEYGKNAVTQAGASACWDHMFDASNADGVKVGPENRPSNIAVSLWISY